MRIVSVNAGQVETLLWGERRIESAINKKPVAGHVHVGSLGLAGDAVAAPNHHGGAFKAVYLYDKEDYAW
jgi:MOSC domain-containing protein YiiM